MKNTKEENTKSYNGSNSSLRYVHINDLKCTPSF